VTTLTIANREKRGQYPIPKRDLNNYRVYSLRDVINLQRLTYKAIDFRPIISVLYDKGFTDPKVVSKLLDSVESDLKGTHQ
jgi:DNA-binding transcriptional MerR regulator